ncbi:kinase-like protein, partial [Ceratobasidium sp. AG-I]
REVHHWSRLRHPNVQELLGVVIFRGSLGMVSPWLEHGNLPAYINKHPEVERYPLCVQLAAGVSYLHGVELANVLVSDDGMLKINDFDCALLLDSSLRFSTTARPGGGTLRWMAPELYEAEDEGAEGEFRVQRNKRTDIYALGMVGIEIFTGTVPFAECRTDAGVCSAILKKQIPRRPSQLSGPDKTAQHVWNILVKCWSYDAVTRPT